MRTTEERGRAKGLLLLLVMVLSFSAPAISGERTLADARLMNACLTNFHICDAHIGDVLEGLAGIGDFFALVDRRVTRALPVNIKLRDGINIAEAVGELARIYGYSCRWDLPARTVVIGNEQSFRDYETMETRSYDHGFQTPEKFVKAISEIVSSERLAIEIDGERLKITTSNLEHRIIAEKILTLRGAHVRGAEEEGIALEIKVKEIDADSSRILGLEEAFSQQSAAGVFSPYCTRISREQQAQAGASGATAQEKFPEESFNLHAVLNKENQQFIGELIPVVITDDEGETTRFDYQKVGATLELTLLRNTEGATLVLTAEVNRITDWKETDGANPVPVVETGNVGAVVHLEEGERFVLSGLALSAAGSKDETGRGTIFSQQQRPDEKRDLAIFISFVPGNEYAHTEAGESVLIVPVAEAPPVTAAEEGRALEEIEGSELWEAKEIESTPLWEAEVVELGSPPALLTGEHEGTPGEPHETVAKQQETPATETYGESHEESQESYEESSGSLYEEGREAPEVFLPGTAQVGLVITYKTKQGEDVSDIAGKYGIPAEALYRTNNLSPDLPPPAGMDLVIPIPAEHLYILNQGETLWRLARRYEVAPELLMEINQISDVTQLMIGQIIILPKPVDQEVREN